jgi:hypothetical protein
MRQMLDRLKKSLGNHDDGIHSFKLAETDEHLKKPEPAPQPATTPLPAIPADLKLRS